MDCGKDEIERVPREWPTGKIAVGPQSQAFPSTVQYHQEPDRMVP